MQDEREREKIDGRAGFAAAAFLIGIGLIYLLQRVGAPDGLVRALGPLFAIAGLALIGILSRASRVSTFFIADRAIPPFYAGLSFAATAAGLALCLGAPERWPLSLAGVAGGLGLNALILSPMLRATQSSALADILATRFPSLPLRVSGAAVLAAIGALVAIAGLSAATDAIVALFGPTRTVAVVIAAAAVASMIGPGGLAGLVWAGAASAGMVLMIIGLPIAAQILGGATISFPAPDGDFAGRALSLHGGGAAGVVVALAAGLGIGALAPLTAAAIASPGRGPALRAGVYGSMFAGLIAIGGSLELAGGPARDAMASGLQTSAILVAELVLAAAGVHAVARAWGSNMTGRRLRYAPLASQRMARSRAASAAALGACALLALRNDLAPATALTIALGLSLGLIAPLVSLALFSRAESAHAAAGAVASLAIGVSLYSLHLEILDADGLLICALSSGAAGFAVGWAGSAFVRSAGEPPARHDFYADAPLDPGA